MQKTPLYKRCLPALALILALVSTGFMIPVLMEFAKTGLVPRFPTLIVCCFVLVAALLDFALRALLGSVPGLGAHYDVLLCPLVTAWYLLTELGSIAENAGALGAPMPQFLMRAIAALRAGISDRGGGDGDGGGAA